MKLWNHVQVAIQYKKQGICAQKKKSIACKIRLIGPPRVLFALLGEADNIDAF